MKNIVITAAAGLAATFATMTAVGPAYAAPQAPSSIAVSYGDLNLAQSQDQRILTERIEGAARQVCRADIGHSALVRDALRDCEEEAVARAIEQFSYPDTATD